MTDNLLTAELPENTTTENAPVEVATTEDSGKPAQIPDKFWDETKKEIRVEALLGSYLALEKRLSKMVPVPESEDDKKKIQKLLGLPDSADQYDVSIKSDVLDIDPELNARLHAKGFTNEQVQEVYDLAIEKMVPMMLELAAEFQADRELERLVEEFGGTEKWTILSGQLQEFGQKNLPQAAYQGLCCSYDGVKALYAMMRSAGKSPISKQDGAGFEHLDEAGLRDMMQNPKYWRERDPTFISKVSQGFQRLYEGR